MCRGTLLKRKDYASHLQLRRDGMRLVSNPDKGAGWWCRNIECPQPRRRSRHVAEGDLRPELLMVRLFCVGSGIFVGKGLGREVDSDSAAGWNMYCPGSCFDSAINKPSRCRHWSQVTIFPSDPRSAFKVMDSAHIQPHLRSMAEGEPRR